MSYDKSLPVRLRQSIRDDYENVSSGIQQRIDSIEAELGQKVIVDPQWHVLSQSQAFADPKQLPTVVARVVNALLDVFVEALAGADAEEQFETLIGKLKGKAVLKIILNTATDEHERFPHAIWLDREAQILLLVPQTTEWIDPARTKRGLADDFSVILAGGKPRSSGAKAQAVPISQAADDGSWDIVSEAPERLPRDDEIDLPQALLSRPPYFLSVETLGKSLVVTASHEESLLLLEAYLKRWTKRSDNLAPPNNSLVKLYLHESLFGSAAPAYDVLEIKAERAQFLSPTLVLSFVRNVLKYKPQGERAYGVRGWEFIRERPFA